MLVPDNNIEILKDGALVPIFIKMVEIPIPILVLSLYKEFKLLSGYSKEVTISLTVFWWGSGFVISFRFFLLVGPVQVVVIYFLF